MPPFTRAHLAALQQELREHAQAAAQRTTTHETLARNLNGMAERLNVHLSSLEETAEAALPLTQPQESQETQTTEEAATD